MRPLLSLGLSFPIYTMGDLSIQSHYSTRVISSNDIFPQSLHYEKVIEPELLWRCCLAPPFATPLYIQVVHRLQLWPGQSFRPIQCHCSSSNLQPPSSALFLLHPHPSRAPWVTKELRLARPLTHHAGASAVKAWTSHLPSLSLHFFHLQNRVSCQEG